MKQKYTDVCWSDQGSYTETVLSGKVENPTPWLIYLKYQKYVIFFTLNRFVSKAPTGLDKSRNVAGLDRSSFSDV